MSDDAQTPGAAESGGAGVGGAADPWAPPAGGTDGPGSTALSGSDVWSVPSSSAPPVPSVHDQPTMTSMEGLGVPVPTGPCFPAPPGQGEPVPPPPVAPDGPGQVPYGYPGGGYGYPGAGGAGTGGGYGYPGTVGAGTGGYGWPGMAAVPAPSNGLGTSALVLGIISAVVFCAWPVSILLGVLALIFGVIGQGKARRGVATNAGQALAGTICGAVGVVLGFATLAFVIATR
ncbi:DUF4190 domain-containing protein [Streptomyces sp. NPDC054829]